MTMETRSLRPIVAGIHAVFGVLALLPVVILTVVFGGVLGAVSTIAHDVKGGPQATAILGVGLATVLLIVVVATTLSGLLGLVGAYGVWRGDKWGDIALTVVSVLHVFNPPVGTLLALFTGWVLWVREPVGQHAPPVPIAVR